jgi:glycosyltransferase involved in cell wall biosynthesis
MRIALVCRVYATHGRTGGMIHVIQERAEALARAGHQVHVITTSALGHGEHELVNGVTVHHCQAGESMAYSDGFASFCLQTSNDLCPEIIHLDSYDCNRLWWHQRPGGVRTVAVSNHGEAVGSQLTSWRMKLRGLPSSESINTDEWLKERSALRRADAVIATCRFDRWMLSDVVGLDNVKLVYNPLAPWHWNGRKSDLPEIPQFIAVALWGQHERGFSIAEAACTQAGVALTKPCNVSRRNLVHYYDMSRALLLPTYQSKGYDLSVAESIARLRPVICSDNGINTMEAIDKPWIVTVPIGNVDALAEKLRGPLPPVPHGAANDNLPSNHIANWLEALG